jgi:hypothetical protein
MLGRDECSRGAARTDDPETLSFERLYLHGSNHLRVSRHDSCIAGFIIPEDFLATAGLSLPRTSSAGEQEGTPHLSQVMHERR